MQKQARILLPIYNIYDFSGNFKPTFTSFKAFFGVLSVVVACSCVTTEAFSEGSERGALSQRQYSSNSHLITLTVAPNQVTPGGTAAYTATTSKINNNSAIKVNYSMSGTATNGTDYNLSTSTGQIVIKKGANSGSITLTALSSSPSRGARTATVTLQPGSGYQLSSPDTGSVTINFPNPTPTPTPSPTPSATPTPTPSPSPTPIVTATPAHPIWVAIRTDGHSGTGTQADPYDGSTQAKFDAILNGVQYTPNVGIYLGAGTFQTSVRHSWMVNSGWVVQGSGMDQTTIQMVGSLAGMDYEVDCFTTHSDLTTNNITIRDLTIDCNWPVLSTTADTGLNGEKNVKVMGVDLFGSTNTIYQVHCMNAYGSRANQQEVFVLRLAASKIADATGNIIQSCRVDQPYGNYGAPFSLAGYSGTPSHVITNSKVIVCYAAGINDGLNTQFSTGGVNAGQIKNCQIDSNTFVDCYGVYYQDTGSCDGVSVTNNILTRGIGGVGFVSPAQPQQNITITGNNLMVQDRYPGFGCCGITVNSGGTNNVLIANNFISFDSTGRGLAQYWTIFGQTLSNSNVLSNSISPSGVYSTGFITGTNVILSNNRLVGGGIPNGLADGTY